MVTTTTTTSPRARETRAAFEARHEREARQWVVGHRREAEARTAAALGGDHGSARRVVARMTHIQRWAAVDGSRKARED